MDAMGRRSFLCGVGKVCVVILAGGGLNACSGSNRKMGTLSDEFVGSSLDRARWDSYGNVTLAGGIVTLSGVAHSAEYSGIKSLAVYDLTDSQVTARLVSAGARAGSTQACLQAVNSGGTDSLTLMVSDGKLRAERRVAGRYSVLASTAYSAASMAWLQIREAAGTTHFEYSADARTWTSLWSGADPITATALHVVIQHGMTSATDPATSSRWALVNPAARVLLDTPSGTHSLGAYILQVNEYNSTDPLVVTSDGATERPSFAVPVSGIKMGRGGAPAAGPSLYYGNHWGTVSRDSRLPVAVSAITN